MEFNLENKEQVYIGIDVGGSGAIAITNGREILNVITNDNTDADLSEFIQEAKDRYDIVKCMVENVHSMPKQGVSSSFKFGESKGFLRGLIVAHKIPFEEASPQKWMKHYGLSGKGFDSKTEHKNNLKNYAQRLYPNMKITLKTADAILLAHYSFLINNNLYNNER